MSTSFQLAGWDFNFFDQVTGATVPLDGLAAQHTRVQVAADDIPLYVPHAWDFHELESGPPPAISAIPTGTSSPSAFPILPR